MGILARQNAVGQECPTYILKLDRALRIPTLLIRNAALAEPVAHNPSIHH